MCNKIKLINNKIFLIIKIIKFFKLKHFLNSFIKTYLILIIKLMANNNYNNKIF